MKLWLEEDTELFPAKDPEVARLQVAVQAARDRLAPAAQAWKAYCTEHADETVSIPFSRYKQKLFDAFTDKSWDVTDAEEALAPVMNAATKRATEAWNEQIRQKFLDDVPVIDAFIEMLRTHEQTVIDAELAGCSGVLNVGKTFLTADEVATRKAYCKQQFGVS